MKRIFLLIFLCGTLYAADAQVPSSVNVGEMVPDLVLKNISNYPFSSAKLSDFKGKLVILDFWTTHCAVCIATFPKMESLQKKFGERIQIILVNTHEDDAKIKERVASWKKKIVFPDLPSVTGDSLIRNYFPYTTVPHHVWIDADGKVIAITNFYNATVEHIQDVLDGKNVRMAEKPLYKKYDWEGNSMLPPGEDLSKKIQVKSAFMKYTPGIRSGIGLKNDSATAKVYRRYFMNYSILSLYKDIFGLKYPDQESSHGSIFWNKNRFVLETKDTSVLQEPADRNLLDEWYDKHSFCYDINVDPKLADAMPEFMEKDLNSYFGTLFKINGGIEKRKTRCWLLTLRDKDSSKLASKQGVTGLINNDSVFKMINSPVIFFFKLLNNSLQDTGLPVVDETGLKGNIDIQLNCGLKDIPNLKKELARYGIIMKEVKREIDILVMKDI